MGWSANLRTGCSIAGLNINQVLAQEGSAQVGVDPTTLPAASAGVLTTRGSASAGTITIGGASNPITAGILDVYWTNSDGTTGSRRGCTIGVIAGQTVAITSGAGDNLPALNAVVACMNPVSTTFVVNGSNIVGFVADQNSLKDAMVTLTTAADAELFNIRITAAAAAFIWLSIQGTTNPLTGLTTIAKCKVSHGDATKQPTMHVVALLT